MTAFGAGSTGFATAAYLRAKRVWAGTSTRRRRKRADESGEGRPFGKGRDPKPLGDVLTAAAIDMGWDSELDKARLITEWAEFVGDPTALHTEVIGVQRGVLQVQCDSTAWATELRRLRGEMLTRVLDSYPAAEIEDIRFLAPGAPTWRYGSRIVRGRGPRDTYG